MPGRGEAELTLWAETTREMFWTPALDGQAAADFAVIGAGYAGLSAALTLSASGARVAVLEAETPGAGASGRNGAGLAGIWAGHDPARILEMFGAERGGRMNALVARSPRLVGDLIARHGIDADLRMNGMLIGANDPAAADRLQAAARDWTALQNPMDWLDAAEFAAASGSDRYRGGLFLHAAGTLNPLSYALGLARACAAAGVAIHCHSPVMAIEPAGKAWRVVTPKGRIVASRVLLAAGSAAMRIRPALAACCYPLHMAVAASAPIDEGTAKRLFPRGLPLADSSSLDLFWMMQTPDRRILGSLFPAIGWAKPAAVAAPYAARIRRLFPGAPALRWEHAWTGLIDLVPRRVPQVLQLAPGLHAILGFSGQGINLATALGDAVAGYLLDGDRERLPFPVEAPQRVPLPRLLPWAMRHMAFPLLRLKARIG